MTHLASGYSYEVDKVTKDAWNNLLLEFNDASFYQTWSYGSISWGERNLSHLILMNDGEVVSIAQLRIATLPLLPVGFAYLPWGPIWKRKDIFINNEHLRNMLTALYNEYVIKRGYLLRITPKHILDAKDVRDLFDTEHYSWSPDPQQTVYVDLTPSIEEIRQNTRPTWRHTLSHALKNNLAFSAGSSDELHDTAFNLIAEMKHRKAFIEFGSMETMITASRDLPEDLKIYLVVCSYQAEPVAVIGWFPISETGHLLLAATGAKALRLNASYTLFWQMIEYYKRLGASYIDLAGISKDNNPGGYIFKTGLAGKKRIEKNYIGQFDACDNILSCLFFKTAIQSRQYYRDLTLRSHKWLRRAISISALNSR